MKKVCLILILLTVVSCQRQADPEKYPILGLDTAKVILYEKQEEPFLPWSAAKSRGIPLIIMSSHAGFAAFDGKHSSSGYLRAVLNDGIISKIYWVIPRAFSNEISTLKSDTMAYLASVDTGLSVEDLKGMSFEYGCLKGKPDGIELTVCRIDNLPAIDEPVYLLLDLSYIVRYADYRSLNKLGALKGMMDSLFKRKYKILDAAVSIGIADGRTRPIHRYLGTIVVDVMNTPSMLKANPPALWMARDNAEALFVASQDEILSKHMGQSLGLYPDDPALLLINAASMVRHARHDEALAAAESLCGNDTDYCGSLQYLGYLAGLKGEDKWAGIFNKRALQLSTGKLPEVLHYAPANQSAPGR